MKMEGGGKWYHLIRPIKGPKNEQFVAEIFTQIRPVWLGEFESRTKKFCAVSDSAKSFKRCC